MIRCDRCRRPLRHSIEWGGMRFGETCARIVGAAAVAKVQAKASKRIRVQSHESQRDPRQIEFAFQEVACVMPERIQLKRAKGWRMPPNTVKVARPGRWGNEYRVEVFGRDLAVKLFRDSVQGYWSPSNVEGLSDDLAAEAYRIHCAMRSRVRHLDLRELRGKNLACWCKPSDPCHADVLLQLADQEA